MVISSTRARLEVEPESLQKSRLGTVSGRIYIETDEGGFPGLGWNDVILPVLCAWVRAISGLAAGARKEERVDFMDGPYYVDLLQVDKTATLLCLVEDRLDGIRCETLASTTALLKDALKAANRILAECAQRAWSDSDVRKLTGLRDQAKHLLKRRLDPFVG
jgi:hypothetical protein